MRRRVWQCSALIPLALALCTAVPLPASYSYRTFDHPAQLPSSSPFNQSLTVLTAINNNRLVAGYVNFPNSTSFVADLNGLAGPTFSVPSALFTYALGIDGNGQVVGRDSNNRLFARSPSGAITVLPSFGPFVASVAISQNGRIGASGSDSLYFQNGASWDQVAVPGAGVAANAVNLMGIDNAGNVVGYYYPNLGVVQSFYRSSSGSFQSIQFPGSAYTEVGGMNNGGLVVGSYSDGATFHGFLWSGGSNFAQLDYPGATATNPHGINDAGEIVGFYRDSNQNVHGFVATPTGVTPPSTPQPTVQGAPAASWVSLFLTGASLIALGSRALRGYRPLNR